MRRAAVLLAFLLASVPGPGHAHQLRWSSGGTDLTFSQNTRATLVLEADSAQALPSRWQLVWDADSSGIQFVALDSTLVCLADTAKVDSIWGPVTPADSAANQITAHFCSDGFGSSGIAYYLLDLVGGSQGKLKAVALNPADSTQVIESNEATYNGGVTGDYPPAVLSAAATHQAGVYTVTAIGSGLSSISSATLVAPDSSWTLPLTVTGRSDSAVTVAATVAALMPSSDLELSGSSGGSSPVRIAADEPAGALADLSVASFLDSTGFIYPAGKGYFPKDFAFFYDGLGHFHLFFIRHNAGVADAQNEKGFGHVSSGDLVHWSQQDTTSFTTSQSAGTWDANHVWAPTLIQQYYLIYAGVDAQGNQSIGYATTSNINTPSINWQRQSAPMFTANNTGWSDRTAPQQFRDPYIMPDPFSPTHWVLYIAGDLPPEI